MPCMHKAYPKKTLNVARQATSHFHLLGHRSMQAQTLMSEDGKEKRAVELADYALELIASGQAEVDCPYEAGRHR